MKWAVKYDRHQVCVVGDALTSHSNPRGCLRICFTNAITGLCSVSILGRSAGYYGFYSLSRRTRFYRICVVYHQQLLIYKMVIISYMRVYEQDQASAGYRSACTDRSIHCRRIRLPSLLDTFKTWKRQGRMVDSPASQILMV